MPKANPAPAATSTGATASAPSVSATAAVPSGSATDGTAQALANSGEAAQRAVFDGASGAALDAVSRDTEPALRVVARPLTFRRAGFEFGPVPREIPARLLTEEQVYAIENEPELVATRVFVPVVPAADAMQEY